MTYLRTVHYMEQLNVYILTEKKLISLRMNLGVMGNYRFKTAKFRNFI
jgi:hypothetical protein